MGTDDAVNDFLKRIDHYCSRYECIDEDHEKTYSFMKIFDAGKVFLIQYSISIPQELVRIPLSFFFVILCYKNTMICVCFLVYVSITIS